MRTVVVVARTIVVDDTEYIDKMYGVWKNKSLAQAFVEEAVPEEDQKKVIISETEIHGWESGGNGKDEKSLIHLA